MPKKSLRDKKQLEDKKAMEEASRLYQPPKAEVCPACGEELRSMPVNSRLSMIACANRRCNLFRQRIRYSS